MLATAVLVTVGVWMHGKAQAGAWQRYIAEKLTKVLSKRSAWFLFGLTFIIVYREVFETIIFYATLWSQSNHAAILTGAATALALLVIVAVAMLRFSRRLPIADFFRYSAILIAILAVVLTGKGIGGLQEAGLLQGNPAGAFPRIDALGFLPTVEGLLAQLAVVVAILIGFRRNRVVAARRVLAHGPQ